MQKLKIVISIYSFFANLHSKTSNCDEIWLEQNIDHDCVMTKCAPTYQQQSVNGLSGWVRSGRVLQTFEPAQNFLPSISFYNSTEGQRT